MGIIIDCNCSKQNKFNKNLEICNQVNNEIFIENNKANDNNNNNMNYIECNIDLEKIKLKNKFTNQNNIQYNTNQTLKSTQNNFNNSLSPKNERKLNSNNYRNKYKIDEKYFYSNNINSGNNFFSNVNNNNNFLDNDSTKIDYSEINYTKTYDSYKIHNKNNNNNLNFFNCSQQINKKKIIKAMKNIKDKIELKNNLENISQISNNIENLNLIENKLNLKIYFNESFIFKKLIFEKEKNKFVNINYYILNKLNINDILYDGFFYKININKNKLFKRYFQITKNCFKYYKNIFDFENNENPLVQFEIIKISNLIFVDVNENNIFNNKKFLIENNIKFIFQINLFNIDDIFLFGNEIEENGKNIFNILNFLIKYYNQSVK